MNLRVLSLERKKTKENIKEDKKVAQIFCPRYSTWRPINNKSSLANMPDFIFFFQNDKIHQLQFAWTTTIWTHIMDGSCLIGCTVSQRASHFLDSWSGKEKCIIIMYINQ